VAKYTIKLDSRVEKTLRRIAKQDQRAIAKAIKDLGANPLPPDAKRLKKIKDHKAYRVRVRDYRILYTIEKDNLVVWVVRVASRKDLERDLKRIFQ